ncbi:MAG: Ig-like domain-containing protein [Candidatus Thiodiazotropha sp.]
MKTKLKPIAAAMALSLVASPVFAVDYYLAAKAYTKTLPDGSTVPMWGYVVDPGASNASLTGCFGEATDAARQACVDALPDPVAGQNPRLEVPPGDNQLRVYISNGLPEPTSIIIPGQELPVGNYNGMAPTTGPTWDDGTTGPRANASQRVRSYVPEAPANGGKMGYIWNTGNAITPTPINSDGTMLYHSGTHPQKQVYMGLAGLVTHDAAAGEVYAGVPYSNEVELFYSDIDPVFNEAVANGTLTTAIDRHPTWFLVNGEPYESGFPDIASGSNGPLAANENTLLRLASTATDTHVLVLQGMDMKIHGEDGQQYAWENTTTGETGLAPREQYSAMMPPGKTKDAIIVAPEVGTYAIYDGDGYMTNPSDPNNEAVGDSLGGMLRFLAFGSGGVNGAPTGVADSASVVAGFSTVISPLTNDTDPEGDTLSIASVDLTGTLGAVTCDIGVASGTCTYDATGLTAGTDSFSYVATDGTGNTAPTTVTVTITDNLAPTAVDDSASTDQDLAVVIDVTANDTDPEGQALTVDGNDLVSVGGGAVDCSAGTSCTYTPAAGFTGADSFTYTVTDGPNTSAPATVDVTVNAIVPPNAIPVAVDDTATTGMNNQVIIDVLANDTDADAGDVITIAAGDAASTQGGTVVCVTGVPNGSCTYTPATGFTGADTFTYTATDGTDTSAPATVTVTVNGAGAPALYFSTLGAGSVPTVAGPFDDADIYTVDGSNVFARLYDGVSDMGLPNNADIDGMSVNGTTIYVSFAAASTAVPGLGGIPDEDVVAYDTVGGTWSTYFDGSACGLDASNAGDVDALSVSGGTLYFSTAGNVAVTGVTNNTDQFDDADVYTWNGTSCERVLDVRGRGVPNILPGNADIDGLTVQGSTYYMSFRRSSTTVNGLGAVQDESVVSYDGANWAMVFSGAGQLDGSNAQNVDAIHVP